MSTDEPKDKSGKGSTESVNLTTHPLVAKGHPDPNEIRDVVSLSGYLGPSNNPDKVRLYHDLTFQHYYEIPRSGIVSTSPGNPDDENSPTTIDLKPDTRLQQVSVSTQNVEASFLKGAISGGFLGAASAAQPAGGLPCFIVMTTVQCTFGGAGAAQAQPQAAQANFTCVPVAQTLATTCTQIHCNHAGTTLATVCTLVTGQAAAPQAGACPTVLTAVPSNCEPNFTCIPEATTAATVCTQVHCNHAGTTLATVCTLRPGQGAAPAALAAPGGHGVACATYVTAVPSNCHHPICLTVVTANPTDCGPICPTLYTAVPSTCRPTYFCTQAAQPAAAAPGVACATFVTAVPSNCHRPVCLTVVTANPTDCGPICLTVVTAHPTDCGPICLTVVTAHPTDCGPICLTVVTAHPTDCGPICPPVYTAVPSTCRPTEICTQAGQGGGAAARVGPVCITIATANPTWCAPCHPAAATAATVCTQTGIVPPPRTVDCPGGGAQAQVACPTVFTAVPTGCHQQAPCPTIHTAVPTWCG